MIPIVNIYKRLLAYALITNKFPVQYSEPIWYLIQLSELPIEIRYDENYVKCQLVTYSIDGNRINPYKELQPRNTREEQIVESILKMIYSY